MSRTVLFAGGGTAGHVFPAVAVAHALRRLDPDIEPVFVGVGDRLEASLVPEAGFRIHLIDAVPVPRRPSSQLLRLPFALRRATSQVMAIARDERAAGAVTFGGYVSFPAARAAWKLQLPLVVHEQNAVAGLANRVASRWADRIAVSLPSSSLRFSRIERCTVTGNPIRAEIRALDREAERTAARERFGLYPDRPTLLVFGGSQGASSVNRAIIGSNTLWGDLPLQILHATGRATYEVAATGWARVRERDRGPRVVAVDFIESMADAYAAADLVVCRAGATTIAELTALGVPSLLVPYPHATADHQTENARALERAGGAMLIEDRSLTAERLVEVAKPLLQHTGALGAMAAAARAFGRPDAADNVAHLVLRTLRDER